MSLTQEVLEGDLQDTFLSEVRPPFCVCSLTSLMAPDSILQNGERSTGRLVEWGPGPASQLLSHLPYQERQVVTLRVNRAGMAKHPGSQVPQSHSPCA